MKQFADFIKLTDKNLNAARDLLVKASNNEVNNQIRLSGFNPNKMSNPLKQHDQLQHGLVSKKLFQQVTGIEPKTLFRPNSLQAETTLMPLVQSRQLDPEHREKVNQTLENIVDVVAYPHDKGMRLPRSFRPAYEFNYDSVLPYLKRNKSEAERLAGMKVGQHLDYMDNRNFRSQYKQTMKNESKPYRTNVKLEVPASESVGDKLRAKLKNREAYSKAYDNSKDAYDKESTLSVYRKTKLLPR